MSRKYLSAGRMSAVAVALGWAGLVISAAPQAFADDSDRSAGPTSKSAQSSTGSPSRSAVRAPIANSPRSVAASRLSAAAESNQGSNYDQLHRNIVIRADIYGGAFTKPSILAANYGFGGITAIPGLDSESEIELAVAAGAGVVGQMLNLDPAAPFRNITSGSSPGGIEEAGFSDAPVTHTFLDAMPIEFSHPVLPSTVLPENFQITLNTGDVVTPYYVAQNPNYDFNERQTIVAFGEFGNRLPTDDPDAIYPVLLQIVASSTPL